MRDYLFKILFLLMITHFCFADHEYPLGVSGNAALGFVKNTGNSNNSNLNGKLHLSYYKPHWKNSTDLSMQINTSNGVRSAEKYKASGESQYRFSHDSFTFGRLNLQKDKFSAYDYNLYAVVGYGHRILKGEKYWIELQAGPGFRVLKETNSGSTNRNIIYAAATWKWHMSDATTLTELLNSEVGRPNTNTRSETSIKTKLIGNLAMSVNYIMDYDSHIPVTSPEKKHLDTTTNITLVYNF